MPTPRKSRRRKRAPIFVILFLVVALGGTAALVLWLWSPDGGPQTARLSTASPALPNPATAPAAQPVPATAQPHAAATEAPEPAVPLAGATPDGRVSAAPAPRESNSRPRLAIIIDDCGQWPVTERAFVALPFPVTLSVLPHVRFGSSIAHDADAAGQGVMLHLPMQTVSGRYPGPGTITVSMDDTAIRSELTNDLAELPEARGVNNHEGSLATQNTRVMRDIADVLAEDGRFFIDSRTSSNSVGEAVARGRGVPSASRSVFLDDVDNLAAIETQLLEAARDARANGSAIAIGHPRLATLAAVRALGPKFVADGVELTLASALVH